LIIPSNFPFFFSFSYLSDEEPVTEPTAASQILWVLSYPGKKEDWEGIFTGKGEAVTEEYSESNTARDQLLDFVLSRVKNIYPLAPPGIGDN